MSLQPALYTQPAIKAEVLRLQVHRLLSYILRRPIGEQENPSRASEPAWDSLKHIELMFLLEDHFEVRFSEPEMSELEDALGIQRALERIFEARRAS
jgi:acyl carrier protein